MEDTPGAIFTANIKYFTVHHNRNENKNRSASSGLLVYIKSYYSDIISTEILETHRLVKNERPLQ